MDSLALFMDAALITLLMLTAFAAILARNLLTSIIVLSVFSLLMAVMYALMGAPDVAMTEAAVGAGISTILFLGAILLTGPREAETKTYMKWLALVVILPTIGLLIYATLGMPVYGSPDAPAHMYVAPYYIQNVKTEIGIPNIVTAILASYRGYDTLGEVVVIMTAGLSVLLLLGNAVKAKK